MAVELIGAEMTVDELLTRYPSTARVFVRRRMACVGCDLARFESLAEVCEAYGQPLNAFLGELNHLAYPESRRISRRAMKEDGDE